MKTILMAGTVLGILAIPVASLADERMVIRMAILGTPILDGDGGETGAFSTQAISISVATGANAQGVVYGDATTGSVASWAGAGTAMPAATDQGTTSGFETLVCSTACEASLADTAQ